MTTESIAMDFYGRGLFSIMKKENGIFLYNGHTINVENSCITDRKTTKNGEKIIIPAITGPDRIEHWKNGYPHCDSGPAIITNSGKHKEYWVEGILVKVS